MTWSWRLERAYWAGEWPLLWRRGWWLLLVLLMLAMMSAIPFVGQLINWILVGIAAVIVIRRVVAARHFDTLLQRRWQAGVAMWIAASWPQLARTLRLEVKDLSGVALVTGAGRPVWDGYTCIVPVSMPPGLAREDLVAVTPRIAQAFNAVRVTAAGEQIGALTLRIEYVDALAQPFELPLGGSWDGTSVLIGMSDGGFDWRLSLGPHTLVAGSSGSGKASLVWGLLLGLVQPIHAGLIEVWGIDRKGGMELAMGRDLLTLFADDAPRSVALLEEAVEQMQQRARELAGVTRQHTPTAESPTVIVLIDELAFVRRGIDGKRRGELVFAGPRGGRLTASNVRRFVDWDSIRAKLDRPDLRIHDLRHTLATLLFAAGAAANDVQAILGHSSMQVTERYSRARSDAAVRANSALDRLMGGA